jgi:hypothetical protein
MSLMGVPTLEEDVSLKDNVLTFNGHLHSVITLQRRKRGVEHDGLRGEAHDHQDRPLDGVDRMHSQGREIVSIAIHIVTVGRPT